MISKTARVVAIALLIVVLASTFVQPVSATNGLFTVWISYYDLGQGDPGYPPPGCTYGNVVLQNRATLQVWQGKTDSNCGFAATVPEGDYNFNTWMDGDQSHFYRYDGETQKYNFHIGASGYQTSGHWAWAIR